MKRQAPKKSFDWENARGRLKAAAAAVAASAATSAAAEEHVLKARAKELARRTRAPEAQGESIDIISFAVGGAKYALGARYITEVIRLSELTPIPGAPAHVLGVTNLRGTVLTVIDPCELFGLPRRGLSDASYIAVFGKERAECGLLVHHASEVSAIPTSSITAFSDGHPGKDGAFIQGLLPGGQMLLDGERLFRAPDLFAEQADG
jgi:purine-binding chemotaxis protein CheW